MDSLTAFDHARAFAKMGCAPFSASRPTDAFESSFAVLTHAANSAAPSTGVYFASISLRACARPLKRLTPRVIV